MFIIHYNKGIWNQIQISNTLFKKFDFASTNLSKKWGSKFSTAYLVVSCRCVDVNAVGALATDVTLNVVVVGINDDIKNNDKKQRKISDFHSCLLNKTNKNECDVFLVFQLLLYKIDHEYLTSKIKISVLI